MESPLSPRSPLAEVECAVLDEGREWMRQEIQKRLQQLADAEGEISPPQPTAAETPAGDRPASGHLRGAD